SHDPVTSLWQTGQDRAAAGWGTLADLGWRHFVRALPIQGRLIAAIAVAAMLGGCSSMLRDAPLATYDLSAPSGFSGRAAAGKGVLVVEIPTAIQTVDSNRMVARSGGQVSYVPGSQWT